MPSEDERIENVIRGLLKLSENRRCINCNSLGPQYVCTNFWTFVCTNCSGVHREFTHRVKSVSMAKFSAEEVRSLEDGGNERARDIYFKTWDPQLNSLPNGSNLMKLRYFIKHVYVERRFTGEKSLDKLTLLKMELKDGFFEKSSYRRYSSGHQDDYYKKHSSIGSYSRRGHQPRSVMNFLEEKSASYQENGTLSARRTRSCARFDIMDDKFRDDDYGNEITPWEVQCVKKEICGDRIPSLKLGEATKEKEKAAETSNLASTSGKQEVHKIERSSSMIDTKLKAVAAPESSDSLVSSNRHEIVPSSNRGNSLSFPSTQQTSQEKASKPSNVDFVEVLLLELATPVVVSTSEVPSSVDALSTTSAALANGANTSGPASNMGNVPLQNSSIFPTEKPVGNRPENAISGGFLADFGNLLENSASETQFPSSGGDSSVEVAYGKQLPETKQHQPSTSSTVDSSSTDKQSSLPIETSSNKHSWPSPESNSQSAPNSEASISSSGQLPHVDDRLRLDNNPADASIPTARKELPADIFTSPYSLYPASVPYGQFHPAQHMHMCMGMQMGVGMQYHPGPVSSSGVAGGSKSMTPFDIDDDASRAQNPMFPYMVPMQGALDPPLSSQMGLYSQPSPLHHQQLASYGLAISPGTDMGRQPLNNMQISRQADSNKLDDVEHAFASLNPLQSISRSQTTTKGRNPLE